MTYSVENINVNKTWEIQVQSATISGTHSVDLSTGNVFKFNLSGDVVLNYTNPQTTAYMFLNRCGTHSLTFGTASNWLANDNTPLTGDNIVAGVYDGQDLWVSGKKAEDVVVPPLDIWSTNPKVAISLRKLISAYTGNCIRVLRTSDSVTQDIGFDSDGGLDTASLLSFIGASSGRVVRWYDQIGSVQNYLSNAPASDGLTGANFGGGSTGPLIVSSGSLVTRNGKPALLFERSGNCPMGYETDFKKNLQKYNIISISSRDLDPAATQEHDVYFGSLTTGGGSLAYLSHGRPTTTGVFAGGRRIFSDTFGGTQITSHTPPTVPVINFVNVDHGSRLIQLTRNNETLVQNTSFATTGTTANINMYFNIGTNNRGNSAGVRLGGIIQEIIGWNHDYNVDKTDIINNLNSYWNVF